MTAGEPAEARGAFEQAFESGLVFADDSPLQAVWAVCLYYTRDVEEAHRQLQAHADRLGRPRAWEVLIDFFANAIPSVRHLHLYVADRRMEEEDPTIGARVGTYVLASYLARYPDALLRGARTLGMNLSKRQHYLCRQSQWRSLSELGMREEALELGEALYRDPQTIQMWPDLAYTAQRMGRTELARNLTEGLFERYRDPYYGRYVWPRQLFALMLQARDWPAATRLVSDELYLREVESILLFDPPRGYGGPDAEPVWQALADRVLRSESATAQARLAAVSVLARQADPDVDRLDEQLGQILAGDEDDSFVRMLTWDPGRDRVDRLRADLLMARGDYEAASRLLEPADTGDSLPKPEWDALRFLRDHADELVGDQTVWRRTRHVFSLGSRGWILLTRDQRLGRLGPDAKAGRIEAIPSPADPWWVPDPNEAIIVSLGAEAVFAVNRWDVYRLDLDANTWQLAAKKPWWSQAGEHWDLGVWQPFLDELDHELRRSTDRRLDIVWPPSQQDYHYPWIELMLSDGTWLVGNVQHRRLYRPRALAEACLHESVELYGLLPAAEDHARVYLCTSRGLLAWQPGDDTVTVCAMPAGHEASPVMRAGDQNMVPRGQVRIGVLPDHGGTTFLLDLAGGSIEHEGLLNESYPRTFWRQKSAAWKRQQCRQRFSQAGIEWPFSGA